MAKAKADSLNGSGVRLEKNRLRAVSLFSWSVEQNARDTQMTTRVTEGARRERHDQRETTTFFFSGCRPRFSRLAASPLNTRVRALRLLNVKKKRDSSQSMKKGDQKLNFFHSVCSNCSRNYLAFRAPPAAPVTFFLAHVLLREN